MNKSRMDYFTFPHSLYLMLTAADHDVSHEDNFYIVNIQV